MLKFILPAAFVIMVIAQLYVPASMIMESEKVLKEGEEFKFKTAPVDPNDPFRGKYVSLNFDATNFRFITKDTFNYREKVFVSFTTNDNGFAEISDVSKSIPETESYVIAAVNSFIEGDTATISVDYPFYRFYMEESKAYNAELAYNESARDTNQTTYALVSIRNGDAVIKDVIINGIPIRQAAMDYKPHPNAEDSLGF